MDITELKALIADEEYWDGVFSSDREMAKSFMYSNGRDFVGFVEKKCAEQVHEPDDGGISMVTFCNDVCCPCFQDGKCTLDNRHCVHTAKEYHAWLIKKSSKKTHNQPLDREQNQKET
jgi:hypothetical protein